MEPNTDRVVQRVLKKLSAVRATFSEQDQAILDSLVVHEDSEVEAHVLRDWGAQARTPAPDEVAAHARRPGAEARPPAPDEVAAHARRPGAEARPPAPDEVAAHARRPDAEARPPAPDEVAAHARRPDAEARPPAPDEVAAHAKRPDPSDARVRAVARVIYLDPTSGEYRIR